MPGSKRHYWIEDVEVAVAPSLGTLSARAQPRGRKQSDSVLLIGDPVSSDPSFPQLRYASAEMSAVSKAFAGRTAVYRADQATPARYRDAMPEQFGVVHFTAHAAANAESPLDSAVILSKDGSGTSSMRETLPRRRCRPISSRSRHVAARVSGPIG